jgi:Flp pilus assembly protein TadD
MKIMIGKMLFLTTFVSIGVALSGCATTSAADTETTVSVEESVRSGDAAARDGDYEAALTSYLLAIDSQETPDPEIWFRVGAVCSHTGESEKALQAYLQVVALNPEHAGGQEGVGLEYMELQAMDQARDHLDAAVTLDPQRWRSHNALGILADRDGDYAAAIGHYEDALVINPVSPMILNNLGYSRYLSGDLEQAARDFYRATEIQADYTPAWSNLGRVYALQGWYADAVNILSRAIDDATAHNHVGYAALQNGDLADAEQLLSEAIRLSPMYYQTAHRNLDLVRAKIRSEGAGSGINPESLNMAPTSDSVEMSVKEVRTVITAGLNVRVADSVEAEIVGYLQSGDRVEVLRESQGWSYVSYPNGPDAPPAVGWARSRYLAAARTADKD